MNCLILTFEMLCLSNAPAQHGQPASVITTDNDPNSATSLIFQLKPAAWFQPQTKRLVAGGELEACHTVFLLFFFYYSAVLYFSLWFPKKKSLHLSPFSPFFSAMFWLHKSIYDDLSRQQSDIFPPENWSSTCISNYGHATEGISEKQPGTRGGERFPPRCCVGYGWVLFNLVLRSKKKKL